MLTPDQVTFLATEGRKYGLYAGPGFLHMKLPPRKRLMGAWLVDASLNTLVAERGLGKTNLLLGMALALAKGEDFIGYAVPEPKRVLFVDAEMSPIEMQERVKGMNGGTDVLTEELLMLSMPHAERPWGLLSDDYDRRALDSIINAMKPDVVILDNKSTLFDITHENDAESWQEADMWLCGLRQRGMAIILAHHTNKTGGSRGSSFLEVTKNACIALKRPVMPSCIDGTQFVLEFTKNRHFWGEDAAPKLVTLTTTDGCSTWQAGPVPEENPKAEEARQLKQQGKSQREIAKLLGVGVATVNRWLNGE